MSYILRLYRAHFWVELSIQFQYRVAMFIWMIGLVITPVVYMVVWITVADSNGGTVQGMSPNLFAGYFISAMMVNQLTYTWIMWEYDYIIRQGQLSALLLRPHHPIHKDIAENLSFKVLTFVVMIPIVGGLIWFFKPQFGGSGVQLIALVPAIIFAFLIQFLYGWTIAIMAFWTNRVSAVNRIYFLGKAFLAGQVAPLFLLPPSLETFASFTPYRWMIAFPVDLIMGWVDGPQIWYGLSIQLFWVVFGLVLSQLVWRAGIKKYGAFGA